jgi:hypothetical protein
LKEACKIFEENMQQQVQNTGILHCVQNDNDIRMTMTGWLPNENGRATGIGPISQSDADCPPRSTYCARRKILPVTAVVVVAVVFVVPVAFVEMPAVVVAVVVGVAPVGAGVGRTLPDTGNPDVAA